MALQKTVVTRQGIEIPDAYFKIVNTMLNGKTSMAFVVSFAKDSLLPAIDSTAYDCEYDIQGDNPIRQAYKYLKTLPEFEGAIDC